ncbi:MAG: hypothetical protein V7641_1647 [Blastocatellia bacterium]
MVGVDQGSHRSFRFFDVYLVHSNLLQSRIIFRGLRFPVLILKDFFPG